jgi:hypothetical protein
MLTRWILITAALSWAAATMGADNVIKPRLGATPPMGWNSWEAFRKDVDEQSLRAQVDAIVKLGLRDAGYTYFVIDGGWKTTQRDANGDLVPDPKKFPSGIKALADYVHEHGMKFGLHEPGGIHDCGKDEPGSQNNEERDAAAFASWGLDFLKYDQCDYIHDEKMVPGAPDLDKIVIRRGDAEVFASEAEAPQNHLSGLVRIEDQPRCSGGRCVAGIGYDNGAVEVPDVKIGEAGKYTLDVKFAYPYFGQNRDHYKQMTLFVRVNGAEPKRIDLPYSIPQRYTTGSVSIDVDLKQGTNSIVFDNPLSQEEDVRLSYIKMTNALNRSGRDVMFSTSGASRPWLWGQPVAHLWRTAGDINNSWQSIINTIDRHTETLRFAGPGFWADPDMLEVGAPSRQPNNRHALSATEQRSQFSLWAIMNAPLFMSADLRTINEDSLKILLNHDVIVVNQDPLGIAGRCVRDEGPTQVFAKRVSDGMAVALLNRGAQGTDFRITTAELGLKKGPIDSQDLWTAENRTITDGIISSHVESHAVTMLRLSEKGSSPAPSSSQSSAREDGQD